MIINEDIIKGKPLEIERHLQLEIVNQILKLSGATYEDTCSNMRLTADIFEILEDHINDEIITLKYNPMGAWYLDESEENYE